MRSSSIASTGKRLARRMAAGVFVLMIGCAAGAAEETAYGRYVTADQFLEFAFGNDPPEAEMLWLTNESREPLERMLGHRYRALRLRYWQNDGKTAWIIDEIGKDLPITIGVVIDDNAIEAVRILEFREVRGWEVRYPFFTDQFRGATLSEGELSADIDGITGATLSVGSVTRVAKAALALHEKVTEPE